MAKFRSSKLSDQNREFGSSNDRNRATGRYDWTWPNTGVRIHEVIARKLTVAS